jgi:hypothetical protein
MEQFDQLEGFDQENTSQYSSFNPNPGANQYITNAYDKLKDAADSSYQYGKKIGKEIGQDIKSGYYDIRNELKREFGELRDDVKSVNIQDFYASDPTSRLLRHGMQSPYLVPAVDNIAYDLENTSIDMKPGQLIKPRKNIIDYNALILLIVILIIFVLWKYFAKR